MQTAYREAAHTPILSRTQTSLDRFPSFHMQLSPARLSILAQGSFIYLSDCEQRQAR